MSAIQPITGTSPAKREQVEALARALAEVLAKDEQSAIDAASAVEAMGHVVVRIIHAAHLGWESRRNGGRFSVHVHRAGDPRRPVTVEIETATPIP